MIRPGEADLTLNFEDELVPVPHKGTNLVQTNEAGTNRTETSLLGNNQPCVV